MPPKNKSTPALERAKTLDKMPNLTQFGLGFDMGGAQETSNVSNFSDCDIVELTAENKALNARITELSEHSAKQAQAIALMHATLRHIMSRQETGWTVIPEDIKEQIIKSVRYTEQAFAKKTQSR